MLPRRQPGITDTKDNMKTSEPIAEENGKARIRDDEPSRFPIFPSARLRLTTCLALMGASVTLGVSLSAQLRWEAPPNDSDAGTFWRIHWYERGLEYANPAFEKRFRVNSPEVVLHPTFGKRIEARENGLMLIFAEEDLSLLTAAEIYLEMWGGHPGTANKRMTVNGRSTYPLPRVGTEETHCTYHYPSISLKISDLVNGYNACQFAVDQGTTFWGHALVDNAGLRVALTNGHPDLRASGLAGFSARVTALERARRGLAGPGDASHPTSSKATAGGNPDGFTLSLDASGDVRQAISAVDFEGYYTGYDENGNALETDWHGFTKGRRPLAHLGTTTKMPFTVVWDTSLLPAQQNVAVRAIVHFQSSSNIVFVTPPTRGLEIPSRQTGRVALFSSRDLPAPFWSRAGQKRQCTIDLDVEPSRIERAELHVNAWTGGPGVVKEYFKLNGRHFPVAEGSRHELIYSRLPVDPQILRRGANTIELLSDTEHHGIEILRPGPCLVIRYADFIERTSDSRQPDMIRPRQNRGGITWPARPKQ